MRRAGRRSSKWRSRPKVFSALAALIILGAIAAGPLRGQEFTLLTHATNGVLSISAAKLANGTARLFSYRDKAGRTVRFILARDSKGKLHAVFDACKACYRFHQGYEVSHGYLVCRHCGHRYKLENMNAGKASCVPVPLPHQAKADTVRVKVANLKAGQWLF